MPRVINSNNIIFSKNNLKLTDEEFFPQNEKVESNDIKPHSPTL